MEKVESIARVRDLASKESVTKKANRHASEKDNADKVRLQRLHAAAQSVTLALAAAAEAGAADGGAAAED